jgi:hypothetical protein
MMQRKRNYTDIFPATAIAFCTGTLFPVRSFKNLGRGILASCSVMGKDEESDVCMFRIYFCSKQSRIGASGLVPPCNMESSASPSKAAGAEAEYDELDEFNSDDDDPNVFKIRDSLEQASGVTYTTKRLHGPFSPDAPIV